MPREYLIQVEGMRSPGCGRAIIDCLSGEPVQLKFDYKNQFLPNDCQVTILDDSLTLQALADKIYAVAEHAVIYEGTYLAGSEADRYKHRH